jgi:hypothetical protein
VTHRVDAQVHPVEATKGEAALNRIFSQSQVEQLPARLDPMLAPC